MPARIREREVPEPVMKPMTKPLTETVREYAQRQVDLAEAELEALKREMAFITGAKPAPLADTSDENDGERPADTRPMR